MKKLKEISTLFFISVFLMTGCTSIDNNIEDNNPNVKRQQGENNIDKVENKDDDNNNDNKVSNVNKANLELVSIDVNTGESIVLGDVYIDENSPIEENLNLVIDEVSRLQFENAPIELVKIEDNIAYIDIREEKDKNYWSTRYFQGSTGASITSYTLIENLLQRSYEGKWIDGIYFSYEGKTDVEFDHLDMDFFGNIIKR